MSVLAAGMSSLPGDLDVDVVDVGLVDQGLEERLQRDEDLAVLVGAGHIGPLLFHDPDHLAGHAPDQDVFPDRVFIAEELLHDGAPQDGHLVAVLVVLLGDEASFPDVKVPDVLEVRLDPVHENALQHRVPVTDGKGLVAGGRQVGDRGDRILDGTGILRGEVCRLAHQGRSGSHAPNDAAADDEKVLPQAVDFLFGLDGQRAREIRDDDERKGPEEDAQHRERGAPLELHQRAARDLQIEQDAS